MAKMTSLPKPRVLFALPAFGLLLVMLMTVLTHGSAGAQTLGVRSVVLSTTADSAVASYDFQFFVPDTNTIGSISFEFCTNSPLIGDPCNAPAGLNVTAAAITSQVGNTAFSVDNADTTANNLIINRPPLSASVINTSYVFSNITNPSTSAQVVYVRIATFAANGGSGPVGDSGAVAFVTHSTFSIDAFVPPYLKLCVGLSVSVNCSAVSGDSIDLGNLRTSQASAGQSQFAAGTNSPTGYAVFALGNTMTSGNNIINPLASPAASQAGTSQFGINLRSNSSPVIGQDPDGAGSAQPTASYDSSNSFAYNPGDMIASSTQPTDYNRMTVSYLVNVNSAQAPGIYATTLTYLLTGQF